MKIAELVEIGKIGYREIPTPHAGPGEIVLKTQAVGLCGTDVKAYFKGHPYFTPPCILGHEFTGTIVEVGPEVDRFKVGERVVAAPYVECGVCDLCQHDFGEMCEHKSFVTGAFQEFILLPRAIVEQGTFRLGAEVDFSVGSLAEPLACVHNGIEKADISNGDTVLVIGGGPMGVMLALLARTKGAQVLLSEISVSRIEAARHLGLAVISPQEEDLSERMTAEWGRDKADRILVAVGSKAPVETAFDMAAPAGRVLLFGGLPKGDRVCIDAFAVHYREISLVGSFGYNLRQFGEAVNWLNDHAQDFPGIITHTFPFSELEKALQLAKEAKGLKIVIEFAEGLGQ
jgi:L-iditol 2-dehydrogenase